MKKVRKKFLTVADMPRRANTTLARAKEYVRAFPIEPTVTPEGKLAYSRIQYDMIYVQMSMTDTPQLPPGVCPSN